MQKEIKILICEDQESDAFVICRNIEKGGFSVDAHRVDTAEGLMDALANQKWDLIISDYNIPGFGGKEALSIVRSNNKDIPFILVSGTVGESTAVEMMRNGATDYLMKDALFRLSEVVKRELDESVVKSDKYKAIEEVKISEQKYRAVIDNALFAILLAPPNGKILESNHAATELFGYSSDEFKNLSRADLLDVNDPHLTKKVVERDVYGRVQGEFIGIKKGGKRFICELASVLFKDINGNTLSSTMISDITERKMAEEQMLKSRTLLKKAEEVANMGSVEIDLNTNERIWSDGFYKLLGFEPNSVYPDMQIFLGMLSNDMRTKYLKWYQDVIQTKKIASSIEVELIQKEGNKILNANAVGLTDSNGNFAKIIAVIQDTTKLKKIEHSNKINELRYAALFNGASDAIFIADIESGELVDMNHCALTLIGFEKEELIGHHFSIIHPVEELENVQQIFKRMAAVENADKSEESYVLHKNGKHIPVLISAGNVFEVDNKTYSAAYFTDLSSKKELELNLEKSHEKLEKLTEKIPIAIFQMLTNSKGKTVFSFVSKGVKNIFKDFDQSKLIENADILFEKVIPEDQDVFRENYHNGFKSLSDFNIEVRVKSDDHTISWIKIYHHPEIAENGLVVWYGYIEDVTLQKQVNLNLEKQNNQLKDIAWTQSHLVRAPLSRLMGLVNVLHRNIVPKEEEAQYLTYLKDSAIELDNIIKEITQKTME